MFCIINSVNLFKYFYRGLTEDIDYSSSSKRIWHSFNFRFPCIIEMMVIKMEETA